MKTVEMICIRCPMGCHLTCEIDGEDIRVSGNTCKRGEEYAVQEIRCPMRTVTSSVRVAGGKRPVCSVKTQDAVPKSSIPAVLAEIGAIKAPAPITIGQVLQENIAGTGVALVATSEDAAR